MRLAEFIRRDLESILAEWESFARTLRPASGMDSAALRDHAQQILEAICKDIERAQTREQQAQKSRGQITPIDARETAAQTHALLRARSGFSIVELAAEYRALRATVLRLWADALAPDAIDLQETIRFNEAIDQALCESIGHFAGEVDRARNLLLGVLGHDLRNPLTTILATGEYLRVLNMGDRVSSAAQRLIESGARMKALLDDLTDFNRTTLGTRIPVQTSEIDLEPLCRGLIDELRAVHPGNVMLLDVQGDVRGAFDPARIQQVLGNLVDNAIRHGAPGQPIVVRLLGHDERIELSVLNRGEVIPPPTLQRMFEPLVRGESRAERDAGLGLGLYICREIARAHGGSIRAESSPTGTVVTLDLPRRGAG